MKTFEIQYIARLGEQKDYCVEMIKARNETVALKKFAKMFKIKLYTQLFDKNFYWEEDSSMWFYWFKCINAVEPQKHCIETEEIICR